LHCGKLLSSSGSGCRRLFIKSYAAMRINNASIGGAIEKIFYLCYDKSIENGYFAGV